MRYFEDEEASIKILKLRNLWGVFSWKGDWSKNSPLWTEEIKERVKPELDDKHTFWIDFEKLIDNFEKFFVSYVRHWNEVKIKGKFVRAHNEK